MMMFSQKKIGVIFFYSFLSVLCILMTSCTDINPSSTQEITCFEDLATENVSLIALGNSDVPVGLYAEELLRNLGIWDSIQDKISYGSNTKEVLSQVASGSVDCGIVYATDAVTESNVKVICSAPEQIIKTPISYPAAILIDSPNKAAASVFLQYLLTDTAKSAFEKAGFTYCPEIQDNHIKITGKAYLTIFAAASLNEALNEIGDQFTKSYPEITLTFNFDSSGTLKSQIESGAEADLFISAAQKQMNELSDKGYIQIDSKIDLLKNEVILIIPNK